MKKISIKFFFILVAVILTSACVNNQEISIIRKNISDINKKLKVLGSGDTKYKSKMSLADALHQIKEINKKLTDLKKINTVQVNQSNLQATMDEQISYVQEISGMIEDLRLMIADLKGQLNTIKNSVGTISTANEGISRLHAEIVTINEKVTQLKEINEINIEEESRKSEQNINETNSRVASVEKKIDDLINVFTPKKKVKKKKEKVIKKRPEPFSSVSYKKAYSKYLNGDFDNAILFFEDYLIKNPNTRLSDNAQYWLGESFYSKMDFEKALNEFTDLVTNFPKSDKVSSALLKSAYSLDMLKKYDQAMSVLALLVEKYSKSDEAVLALNKIAELKKKIGSNQ